MQKVFRIIVDISRKIPTPAFEVNTNDLKSVKLEITITSGLSLLDLTGITPRINIKKPDNELVFQDCEIVDAKAGKVQIILENQAYLVPGTHTAEIACYKGSEITAITGTFSYKSIQGLMNDEAVESKSEFTAITGMIKDTRDVIEDLRKTGTGIDAQARQDIQQVSEALEEKASKVEVEKIPKYSNVEQKTKVFGHQGFSKGAPQNTIPAIELAARVGYDGVDIDTLPTSDGVWVVIHNTTVDDATNGTGKVIDKTYAEIQALTIDAGNNIEKHPNLKVPTLQECLLLCKNLGLYPVVEMKWKSYTQDDYDSIIALIRRLGMEDIMTVSSFQRIDLNELRRRSTRLKLSLLGDTEAFANSSTVDYVASLTNATIAVHNSYLTETFLNLAHSQNVGVNVWTVNNRQNFSRFLALGVDSITTDLMGV